jgi:hypothetical protein
MIFKNNKLYLLALIFALAACKSSDPEPTSPIEGTWKIQSIILTDANGQNTDLWAIYLESFACSSNITYTFKDGEYTTDTAGCVDGNGDSNALLAAEGGTYTLTEDTIFVDIDGSTLPGTISFSENTATVTTINPNDLSQNMTIVFVKV